MREPLRGLHRNALGNQLPENHRDIGDHNGHHDKRRCAGGRCAQPQILEEGRYGGCDLGRAEGRRKEPGNRHADLNGGKKAIGISREALHRLPGFALPRHFLDLGFAQGHERHFRGRKYAAEKREKKDKQNVEQIHSNILLNGPLCLSWQRNGRPVREVAERDGKPEAGRHIKWLGTDDGDITRGKHGAQQPEHREAHREYAHREHGGGSKRESGDEDHPTCQSYVNAVSGYSFHNHQASMEGCKRSELLGLG